MITDIAFSIMPIIIYLFTFTSTKWHLQTKKFQRSHVWQRSKRDLYESEGKHKVCFCTSLKTCELIGQQTQLG